MSFIYDEVNREDSKPPVGVWYGVVAKSVVDFATLLQVIVPDFDPDQHWGGCRWQSRDGVTFPAKGDECLIMFDSRNQPWVIAWWPF